MVHSINERPVVARLAIVLTVLAVVLATHAGNATVALAREAESEQITQPIRRLKQNDVLDTWKYYFCFANPSAHNHGPYAKTYKRLAFKESYARGKDRTLYHTNTTGRCSYGHSGAEYKYQATYYTW